MRNITGMPVICLITVLALVSLCVHPRPAAAQEFFDAEQIQRATVQIMQFYTNTLGQPIKSCMGSGTLVSSDGLILTNAHVVLESTLCRRDRLVVALSLDPDEPPIPRYNAEVVATNIGWDLAILQITETLDGRPVDRASLTLPAVELGDSETVRLDDTVEVVGYTESEDGTGERVQLLRSTIGGFTAEARVGDRAWLKLRNLVPGSMSGGAVYDTQGRLIGIPTVEPARGGAGVSCRRVQDSNGDGRVDEQDTCVPVSGPTASVRPVSLARGLFLAARIGVAPRAPNPPSQAIFGEPTFSRLFFSPGVESGDVPTGVVTSMPAGTQRLYLFFDYNNMQDGLIYELRVTRDGRPDPVFGLAPATWSGGTRGLWYIGSVAQVYPNGVYEFILFIEGERAASARIVIGGAAPVEPQFTNILFGVLDASDPNAAPQLVSTGSVLPVSNVINAEFVFNNMQDGAEWRQAWYYEGIAIRSETNPWADGANGKKAILAQGSAEVGLQPGRYRLELYIADRMVATADFVMAGGQVEFRPEIFSNLNFASELRNGLPAGTRGTNFAEQVQTLFATFDWRDLAPNTPWTWRWTVDGNLLFQVTQPWYNDVNGTLAWLGLASLGDIPDGSYTLEIIIGGVVWASQTATVGLGQLPVTIFARVEGVPMSGLIVDATTGEGIPGVTVIVLKPEFAVDDFTRNMAEVYSMAITDFAGQFILPIPLAYPTPPDDSEFYSIIIMAEGYLPLAADGIEVTAGSVVPIVFERLEMNRD
jgi:hypothetical protein